VHGQLRQWRLSRSMMTSSWHSRPVSSSGLRLIMSTWTDTMTNVHERNGLGAAPPAAYSNLGLALTHWRVAPHAAASDAALGIQTIIE
jgi:hypothetical protein